MLVQPFERLNFDIQFVARSPFQERMRQIDLPPGDQKNRESLKGNHADLRLCVALKAVEFFQKTPVADRVRPFSVTGENLKFFRIIGLIVIVQR